MNGGQYPENPSFKEAKKNGRTYFERVKSEEPEEKAIGKCNDKSVDGICAGYEEYCKSAEYDPVNLPIDIALKLSPAKENVLEFTKNLVRYADLVSPMTAQYLSALMSVSLDREFVLDFTGINEKGLLVSGMGYNLENKILTINGDVGDFAGVGMADCTLIVNGSAGNSAGSCLRSKIIIYGNAGENLGHLAQDSKIFVSGEIKSIGVMDRKTEIYQKQKSAYAEKDAYVKLELPDRMAEGLCPGLPKLPTLP